VAVLVFLFVHLLPGDPRGSRPAPKPTTRRSRWCAPTSGSTGRCRQFANFFVKIAHGDSARRRAASGRCRRDRRALHAHAAADARRHGLGDRFGMAIGIASAVWRNRWPDRLGMTLAVSGISFPAFALGCC
jgi:glutathione transport system permease protein